MSANNWATCPVCLKKAEAERVKAMEKAAKAYGKLPPDEWKAMSEEASKPLDIDQSMREDWELGVGSDGVFDVSYRASCQDCKFVFTFKAEQNALKGAAQ